MSDQPEALQLADCLDRYAMTFDASPAINVAAAELRRQHAAIAELVAGVQTALRHWPVPSNVCGDRQDYLTVRALATKYGDRHE